MTVGGLVGQALLCTIDNCYATGDVHGLGNNTLNLGGLIGYVQSSNVYDSYATGNVEGYTSANTIGAFVGGVSGTNQFVNNFYNEDATVTNNGAGGVNYDYADEATVEELAEATHDVYNRSGSEWIFSGEDPVWVMDDLPELVL